MSEIISGIYKITNKITGDFYIGSSKNIKERWASHKWQSTWNRFPNNPMYQDMKKYGTDSFVFEILEIVEPEELKVTEQQFIETLKPAYNQMNANGIDVDKYKKYQKEYEKTDKGKESHRKASNKYNNQLCCYNNETLTLHALRTRFRSQGLSNPTAEAKKYLLKQ